jgi:hypothetical protein
MAVLVGAGLAHGLWINRWQQPADLGRALEVFKGIPERIGDWEARPCDFNVQEFTRAGADAVLVREYEHRFHHSYLNVILIGGRGGPVSVHTPEICFQGIGFDQIGHKVRHVIGLDSGGPSGEFWQAYFRQKTGPLEKRLRLFWGWRVPRGNWLAPDDPRWTFATERVLYKLYVSRPLYTENESEKAEELIPDFLKQLLPHLK